MGYNYIVDHTLVNFSKGNTGRKYIVYHYTGNRTDTAKGNANYFRNENRGASAHYFIDDNDVYEVVSPDNTAWAVGVDYGGALFNKCTNGNSISIELCSVNGEITEKTIQNAALIGKELMNKYGIPIERVVRHYDVCNKRCPGWDGWVPKDESKWISFKQMLDGESTVTKKQETNERREATMMCLYTIDGKGPVFYFDGKESHPLSHPDEVTILNKIYKDNNGKDLPCYSWSSKAPWHIRLKNAVERVQK